MEIGSYRIVREIDRGPLSTVFKVEHVVLGTAHALKLLAVGQDRTIAESLVLSARLQARSRHPNLVRVTDAGVHDGRPYHVSDWVEGTSLATWLDTNGPMPVPTALAVFRGVVEGARALHSVHVVHRDLKPSNVLLAERGPALVPMINDLGLAKEWDPDAKPVAKGLSREYRTLGTPEYMAPEQSAHVGEVDGRADLWSLGVLLYEMLTDEVPFEGETAMAVVLAARLGRYVALRERAPQVPENVDRLVSDLLVANPVRRIQTASEILVRLERG